MSVQESQLKNELQSLQESFRELSLRLAETAGNLGRSGRPPSEEIIQQLEGAHRRFRELHEGALQLAAGERLAQPTGSDGASIPDLLALLRQVDETRAVRLKKHDQLQKARTVLDRILGIVHKNSPSYGPLVDLHAKAGSLREQALADSDQPVNPELETLAEGRHPYCDLLHLMDHHDDIDDDRWVQLNDSITQAFGKPMAIATARKKLRITEGPGVRSQESGVRSQESGVRDQEPGVRGQESEVRRQESEVRDQESEIKNRDFASPDSGARAQSVAPALSVNSSDMSSEWNAEAAATATATLEASPWEQQSVSAPSSETSLRTLEIDLDSDRNHAALGPATEVDLHVPKLMPGEPLPENEGTLRRAFPEDPWLRSPLTAQQELDLLAPTNGVAVLFGSRVAGLDEVDRFLHAACREGRLITLDTANDRRGFLRQLDELLKERPEGLILGVVPDYCPWSEDWVLSSLELIGRLTSKRKFARVLFVADPEATWSWVQTDKNAQDRMVENGVAEFSLETWSEQAVRQWMSEAGFGPDDQAGRDCFANVTGNWGALLYQVGLRCKQDPQRWQEVLVDYERELSQRVEWRELFGLVGQALPVLKVMAERDEPVSWEEISSYVGGGSPILVAMVLCWADRLRYIRPAGQKKWVLDPIIRHAVLKTEG
jgi:hypothetical protein